MIELENYNNMTDDNNPARILVIGVGGGGNNAVERMLADGICGTDFLTVNTDKQVLFSGKCSNKLLIGQELTKGRGAGGNAEIGRMAAEESEDEIRAALSGMDMVFITAGMGGGTGTGAAPVIAKIAQEENILTIGVVTKPFHFEGNRKAKQAKAGIETLSENVDTLITVSNDRLLDLSGKETTMLEAFRMADEVLREGVQGVSDLICRPGEINVDFADVRSTMEKKGYAHMGIGIGEGKDRAQKAAEMAISSPLLDTKIDGARSVLINISGGENMGILEFQTINDYLTSLVDEDAMITIGASIDPSLDDEIRVTVIATEFEGMMPKRADFKTLDQAAQTFEKLVNETKPFTEEKPENPTTPGRLSFGDFFETEKENTSEENNDTESEKPTETADPLDIPGFLRRHKK